MNLLYNILSSFQVGPGIVKHVSMVGAAVAFRWCDFPRDVITQT